MKNTLLKKDALKARFWPSFFCTGAFAFTFILYGALQFFLTNSTKFPFYFNEIFAPLLLFSILVFLALLFISVILPEKAYLVYISIIMGITIGGFLQGTSLNIDFGLLDGYQIPWHEYTGHAIFNSMLWLAILAGMIVLCMRKVKAWRLACITFSIGIIAAGLIQLALPFYRVLRQNNTRDTMYLSSEGILDVSAEENILVFTLDYMDLADVEAIISEDPHFFDPLEGFTQYPDHVSVYGGTYPSVAFMFSGEYATRSQIRSFDDAFFERAWSRACNELLQDLAAQDYAISLYLPPTAAYRDARVFNNMVQNVALEDSDSVTINTPLIIGKLLRFSAYKYAPHVLKQFFWIPLGYFDDTVVIRENLPARYSFDDPAFYDALCSEQLQTNDFPKQFSVIHLYGAHPPYTKNALAQAVSEDETNRIEAAKGAFHIVFEYLKQLRDLGLYDTSSIIITADHGNSRIGYSVETGMPNTILYIKPQYSNMPLEISEKSVSHENFRATIAYFAGVTNEEYYGDSVFTAPDIPIGGIRKHYQLSMEFEIAGDSRDAHNWKQLR